MCNIKTTQAFPRPVPGAPFKAYRGSSLRLGATKVLCFLFRYIMMVSCAAEHDREEIRASQRSLRAQCAGERTISRLCKDSLTSEKHVAGETLLPKLCLPE